MPNRPTLYVALKGPLLVPSDKPHDYLEAGVADYAKGFLGWAKGKFNVQILTDDHLRKVHALLDHLNLPDDAATPRAYDLNKTDLMKPDDNFFWIDSALIPSEIQWLGQHMIVHRVLTVDPTVGVTPEHKRILENLTAVIRK